MGEESNVLIVSDSVTSMSAKTQQRRAFSNENKQVLRDSSDEYRIKQQSVQLNQSLLKQAR